MEMDFIGAFELEYGTMVDFSSIIYDAIKILISKENKDMLQHTCILFCLSCNMCKLLYAHVAMRRTKYCLILFLIYLVFDFVTTIKAKET